MASLRAGEPVLIDHVSFCCFFFVFVLAGHSGLVRCVRFDLTRIVSGSYDNTIRVWDFDTGDPLFVRNPHPRTRTYMHATQALATRTCMLQRDCNPFLNFPLVPSTPLCLLRQSLNAAGVFFSPGARGTLQPRFPRAI